MADYASDSSSDGEGDVQTNVLLGYASKEPTEDEFSQLGGTPTWLDGETSPSGTFAKCGVCSRTMSLLLQLNCDLPQRFPNSERRLYIFGCRHKACRRKNGCIRAVRGVRRWQTESNTAHSSGATPITQSAPQAKVQDLGETLFGVQLSSTSAANPFSVAQGSGKQSNPFSLRSSTQASRAVEEDVNDKAGANVTPQTFAQKAASAISSPSSGGKEQKSALEVLHQPWPTDTTPYPKYHVDADNEYLESEHTTAEVPTNARLDGSSDNVGSSSDDKTLFESSMDKTFQRFADRLSQNPEQILRYEFGGVPLLYSKTDHVGELFESAAREHEQNSKVRVSSSSTNGITLPKLPRCSKCGEPRVFELQLTPHAITELEAEDTGLDGMEWGTIIVAVCSVDCQLASGSQVGYTEEWAGVQWEEVASGN